MPSLCHDENPGDTNGTEEGVYIDSPHLRKMKHDVLHHLALGTATHNLKEMFGDVKFVCMGGTPRRMERFAHFIKDELGIKLPTGTDLVDISASTCRYSLYKIGPVLSVSHGMGSPSLSILLHEILKLIHYADCKDVTIIRIGTSGGVGIEPGSVVVSTGAVDGLLRPVLETHILGKVVLKPALLDQQLAMEITEIGKRYFPQYNIVNGKSICANDFYEGQGRLDGAFCNYGKEDKMKFLRRVQEEGVVNFEMECVQFAAMCSQTKVKGAIVCVTLVDRLDDDQVTKPKPLLQDFEMRPKKLVATYIKQKLGLLSSEGDFQAFKA